MIIPGTNEINVNNSVNLRLHKITNLEEARKKIPELDNNTSMVVSTAKGEILKVKPDITEAQIVAELSKGETTKLSALTTATSA